MSSNRWDEKIKEESFNDVFVKLDAAEDAKPGLATIRDVAECC